MLIFKGKNRVTSPYGNRTLNGKKEFHGGIDIVGDDNEDILCPVDGVVRSSTIINDKSDLTWTWGNYVRVDDKDGNRLFFCHMASRAVKVGQRVTVGDKLGVMGNTGYSFGVHTHFEVRKPDGKTTIDPAEYLGIPNERGTYTEAETFTGWKTEGSGWYYHQAGSIIKSKWIEDEGYWYYLGSDGRMLTGMQRIGGKLYYLNESRREGVPTGALIVTDGKGVIRG